MRNRVCSSGWWLSALLSLVFFSCLSAQPPRGPLAPEAAQRLFQIHPDLRIELVACEPAVLDPVALAFAPDGKLWVVEMGDYPNGPAPGKPPRGRIRVLEDRDGDGRYEHSSVFAEHLLFANGLFLWRDGVIVTMAPQIVFLRDTDGDGKADTREVLYEGFTAENPQLRVSHPQLGLDGWVYVANGLRGGKVRRARKAEAEVIDISGMDFRFDLLGDRQEAISGMGQFGNAFDDWGQRFVCDNRHHLRHVVLPNAALKRNPYLAVRQVLADISELEEGVGGSGGKIYPLSKNWTTSNLHAGHFTAACGVFIYRGALLPDSFRAAAYTCDPTGNLVHREIMKSAGATFRSHPARKGVEFLASPDDWFRPVFLSEGPDGAIYVADMYRAVIEHPQFMPTELKNRPDLLEGSDRGRIWRIVPKKHKTEPIRPETEGSTLDKAPTPELVRLLAHPGGWWRTTAQRLLLERQDRASIPPLETMLRTSPEPRARVLAAWLLKRLDALGDKLLLRLLVDDHPRVREQAVILAADHLTHSGPVRTRLVKLARDPDARVRYQLALALGNWKDEEALAPLAQIALAADDSWTRVAVATAIPDRAGALLRSLFKLGWHTSTPSSPQESKQRLALLDELANLVGARRDPGEVGKLMRTLLDLPGEEGGRWRLTGFSGLAEGMARRGTRLGSFLESLPASEADTVRRGRAFLARAADRVLDTSASLSARLEAASLLAHTDWETAAACAQTLFKSRAPQELQSEAVRALAAHARAEVPRLLLPSWRSLTPGMRRAVTDALLRRTSWTRALLEEVKEERIRPGEIDVVQTRRLLRHRDAAIRKLAEKLLRDNLPAERTEVLARYRSALKLKGDARKGRAIFQEHCAVCHRVAGIGVEVGPVISDTRTKTREALLNDILNPNQAIDNNYLSYLIELKSGKALTGIITTETGTSITLKQAEGKTEVLLRQDILELASSGVSLMPEGLEMKISTEQMADLLSFLKNWRYLDGKVPKGIRAP
jgi:putative membrane-bound dehydrogenase-like protein